MRIKISALALILIIGSANATSAQEFQEIATAVRTVADIRRVFTYNAQKAMIVRGNVDAVELAEKMIHDLDKPKSEVVETPKPEVIN